MSEEYVLNYLGVGIQQLLDVNCLRELGSLTTSQESVVEKTYFAIKQLSNCVAIISIEVDCICAARRTSNLIIVTIHTKHTKNTQISSRNFKKCLG